jgi:hypothetical protein
MNFADQVGASWLQVATSCSAGFSYLCHMTRRGPDELQTCREYVLPGLEDSGWLKDQIYPQYPITAGRVVFRGRRPGREAELRADYALEVSAWTRG